MTVQDILLSPGEHQALGLGVEDMREFELNSKQKCKLLSFFESNEHLSLEEAREKWLVIDMRNSMGWTVLDTSATTLPTLTASHNFKGLFVLHKDCWRFMTPFEHMKAMGFSWTQIQAAAVNLSSQDIGHMAGNAVTARSAVCVLHTVFQCFPSVFLGRHTRVEVH
jgi:hypothetical protein